MTKIKQNKECMLEDCMENKWLKSENYKKNIEGIIYITQYIEGLTVKELIRLFYYADFEHMLYYGRFITGGDYENGLTPNNISQLLKSHYPLGAFMVIDSIVIPLREPDEDTFSDSDISCMNQIINDSGKSIFENLPVLPRTPVSKEMF